MILYDKQVSDETCQRRRDVKRKKAHARKVKATFIVPWLIGWVIYILGIAKTLTADI
jgi:hypothetical protein